MFKSLKFLQKAPLFQDIAQKAATVTRGIPWRGWPTPRSFMAYFPRIENGIATLRSGRRYDLAQPGGGWRVMNKPPSRRTRHRAAVAARKAGRA